jgi:hypothetical protein
MKQRLLEQLKIITNVNQLKNCFFIMLLAGLFNCQSSGVKEVDEEIMVRVGKFNATHYEIDQAFNNLTRSNARVNRKGLDSWRNDLLSRGFLLADAYAKGYDTLKEIKIKLDYAFKYKIAQEDGYLWQRNVAPQLAINDSEIYEAYAKRTSIYHLDFLLFPDEKMFSDVCRQTMLRSSADFQRLVIASRGKSEVQFASQQMLYPFSNFPSIKDNIYKMNLGEVVGPVWLPEGLYVIHLRHKQNREMVSIVDDKENINYDLMMLKRRQAICYKQDSIFAKARIAFKKENIKAMALDFKNRLTGTQDNADTAILMTYYFRDSLHRFTVKDYRNFIRYMPILVGDYAALSQIHDNLKDHAIREYLYEEAENCRLLTDKKFLLDKKMYLEALMEQYYVRELGSEIRISDDDLMDHYNKNLHSYRSEPLSWVTFLEFVDENAASNCADQVQAILTAGKLPDISNTNAINTLLEISKPELINKVNTSWTYEMKESFWKAPEKIIFGPIRHNDRVYLYYVNERRSGGEKDFSVVKGQIYDQLKSILVDELKRKRLAELRAKYIAEWDALDEFLKLKYN